MLPLEPEGIAREHARIHSHGCREYSSCDRPGDGRGGPVGVGNTRHRDAEWMVLLCKVREGSNEEKVKKLTITGSLTMRSFFNQQVAKFQMSQ